MAQNVTIAGASYPDVPSIVVPKTGGGSAAFLDTSDADATAADVRSGKKFYGSSGSDTGSMPDGSAATPATAITAAPSITVSSSGLITASVSKSQNVTPTVSPGYVANGTAGTIAVSGSNTNQLATQAGQTITPGTSDIVIPAQKFLTGAQTIKGDANLVAANIAKDVTIFGVTGTLSGGGFSNTDALVHVNAPLGSTVTFAKGGVTVKVLSPSDAFNNVDGETADYYYSIASTNFGTWTVTATLSGVTTSDTVTVSAAEQYNLALTYRVPSAYQAVEYLERPQNSGAYFNTGLVPSNTTFVEVKFKVLTWSGYPWAIGCYISSSSWWGCNFSPAGAINLYYTSSIAQTGVSGYSNTDNVIQWVDANKIRASNDDGATFTEYSKQMTTVPTNAFNIFAASSGAVNKGANVIRVKEVTIGTAKLVPCYRKSDNVCGFWNQRDEVFLTNSGADSVIAGPDL